METWQIVRAAIDAITDKAVAYAMGYDRGTVHRMARHPQDADDPDGTGSKNIFDRVEGLIQALAVRQAGRPVLTTLRAWFNGVCDDALGLTTPEPLTPEALSQHTALMCREFGEMVSECRPGDCDHERLIREATQCRDAIDRLIRAAMRGTRS